MKQFSILNGKAHVVELPEGVIKPRITQPFGIYLTFNDRFGFNGIKLPPGIWQIVGMLPEITEEQAGTLVEKVMNGQHYQNYNYKSVIERWVKTAIESLESAILAEGWYFENPYAENLRDAVNKSPNRDYGSMLEEANIFREAQSRVLCRERTLILKRN